MLDPHELPNIIEPPALKAVQLKGQLGFDIPAAPRARRKLTSVKSKQDPSWTVDKSDLVPEYMRLFLYITKHGAFLDLCAGPQYQDRPDLWIARRVLELEPKWLRDFHFCEVDSKKLAMLQQLRQEHSERDVSIYPQDLNQAIHKILRPGVLGPREATFCLIDQHTFECRWDTLEAIAHYKSAPKIELLYFIGYGWLDRAFAAISTAQGAAEVQAWWGRDDLPALTRLRGVERVTAFAERFANELDYEYVAPWPIRDKNGRVMYYLVHASDHPEAPKLMLRAYRKVQERSAPQLETLF
jgi:three-Cys-motif partner protein